MKKLFCLSLFIVLLNHCILEIAYADKRDREKTARQAINTLLQSTGKDKYEVNDIADIDSLLDDMKYYDEPLEDPYGTLAHCFIFTTRWKENIEIPSDPEGTYQSQRNMVGIYKDNAILWLSNSVIAESDGRILTTRDINNDGTVDILTQWGGGLLDKDHASLWIHSWNGAIGLQINATVNADSLEESVIFGLEYGFLLFDAEGDGVLEIKNLEVTDGSLSWSWNGSQYGTWLSTRHISDTVWLPRNGIDVEVNCRIQDISGSLKYYYSVTNKPTSKQRIDEFYVQLLTDSVQLEIPANWEQIVHYLFHLQGWGVPAFNHRGLILPQQRGSGFNIIAEGLPAINKFYIQAENAAPNPELMTVAEYSIGLERDIVENSIQGLTVSPSNYPVPCVALPFLDTLSSYTTQSRWLGWIKDQATADKYSGYFVSAKTSLQQNNIGAARSTLQQVLQDVNADSISNITSEAYALLRYNTEYLLSQLPVLVSGLNVKLINSTSTKLTSGSLQYYEGGWKDATNNNDGTFTISSTAKTLSLRMTYEYSIQTKSNVTVGPDTVVFQTVNAQIQLQDSRGGLIDTGTVQYYSGAWRSLGTTAGGIAQKELLPGNYSFRMAYAYASKDKQQDISTNPTVVFQTVSASVQLQNSQGTLVPAPSGDQGTVQYYAGAWRDFGVTASGVATKELLPNNYSFRMMYAFASKDKQQDIGANPTVVFETVNATVQLQNSQGTLMPAPLGDQGTVQYYTGAWRDFGVTTGGVAAKELLPNTYSFRMTYAYASKDKQQDVGVNPTVIFQTVNASVQLENSQGSLVDQGTVQYYSGAWRDFGVTASGVATKELLPNNYSFRMTYVYASKDKQQDIGTNPSVVFQTVNATVQLRNSQGNLIDQGAVQYYAGAWRDFGVTAGGVAAKELLPNSYSFRMTYEFVSDDRVQDISSSSTVNFSTVLCTVRVKDAQNQPVDGAQASYYSGAWRQIGTTVNGEVTRELLPVNLTFRINYGTEQQDKTQNLSINNIVDFNIQP